MYIALIIKYEKIKIIFWSPSNLYSISIYPTASQTRLSQYLANASTCQAPISLHNFIGNQPIFN